eukprot:2247848-Amphidinium_carterae.2
MGSKTFGQTILPEETWQAALRRGLGRGAINLRQLKLQLEAELRVKWDSARIPCATSTIGWTFRVWPLDYAGGRNSKLRPTNSMPLLAVSRA